MNAQSEIRQQIELLYSQNASNQRSQEIVHSLKQHGLASIRVILKLAETAQPQKRYFLFNLISELGNKQAIEFLENMLEQSGINDETQLLIMMTIVRLGGQIDFETIITKINNYEILCRFFALSALSAVDNPVIFEELIDQLADLSELDDELIWDELTQIKNDSRLIPLASALLDRVKENWYPGLITIFENSQSTTAFPYLKELIQRTGDTQIQEAARRAIFRIAQHSSAESQSLPYQFYKAFVSGGDGDGSTICIFSVRTRFDSIKLLTFVLNDLEGVKEAFGLELPLNAFDAFVKKMSYGGLFEIAEVDAEYIFARKEFGEQLSIENRASLPTPYLVWRTIFNCDWQRNPKLMRQPGFSALTTKVYQDRLKLLPETPTLFENIEIKMSWFLDFYELEAMLHHSDNSNAGENPAFNATQKMTELFDVPLLQLLKSRLEHYAYVCFLNKSKANARLALAAAQTLFEIPVNEHPFLKQMFVQTLNFIKNGFELNNTGLEETWFKRDVPEAGKQENWS